MRQFLLFVVCVGWFLRACSSRLIGLALIAFPSLYSTCASMAPWMKKGNVGSPTTNAAERALLEGFRMGMKSSQDGKARGKGADDKRGRKGDGKGGKGGGKDKEYPPAHNNKSAAGDLTCRRKDCRAAEKQQATRHGACNCFVCGLTMTSTLPVEQLCDWAFVERVEEKKVAALKKQGAADGGTVDKPQLQLGPATSTLRTDRLAILKAAEEGRAVTPPPTLSPTQEVARVFVDAALPPKRLELDSDTIQQAKGMQSAAAAILEALRMEEMPADNAMKTPKEILEGLLAKSAHSKKDSGKSLADQALQVTRDGLKAMRNSGATEDDEIIKLMVAREVKQARDAQALHDKQPSVSSRKLALESIRSDFAQSLGEQADRRTTGAAKASLRAAVWSKTADALIQAAQSLKAMAEDATATLNNAHRTRALQKEQQGADVLKLLGEQLKDLEAETPEDVVFVDAVEEDTATTTENERDEAVRLTQLLTQQLLQLKIAAAEPAPAEATPPTGSSGSSGNTAQASGSASANVQPVGDNDPAADVWREFTADVALLPKIPEDLKGMIDADKEQFRLLTAFFAAMPWGAPTPAVTFHVLGAHPSVVHGLVGDTMWEECWGEKHARITNSHIVPFSLIGVLKFAVEQAKATPSTKILEEGKNRWTQAKADATERRKRGSPY